MTLSPIDSRRPTPAEIDQYRQDKEVYPEFFNEFLAELRWREAVLKEDPDAFLVEYISPDREEAYNQYRRSAKWQRIRAAVLQRYNGECAGCEKMATEVHHRDYRPRVLDGRDLNALVALCDECHGKVEFARQKKPGSWIAGEEVLADLIAKRGKSQG